MQPLTIITGIVLGSAASISLGLAVVMLIFLILGDEYPRLAAEFRPLIGSLGLFIALTVISAGSFWAQLNKSRWRWPAQILMWCAVFVAGAYYWPE
jgi:hypothetical protein